MQPPGLLFSGQRLERARIATQDCGLKSVEVVHQSRYRRQSGKQALSLGAPWQRTAMAIDRYRAAFAREAVHRLAEQDMCRIHALELDGSTYAEAVTPAAGSAFDVYVHSLNGSGICGVSCSFASNELRFFADGQFVSSSAASSTTPQGSVTVLPADQHGTYAVADGGRITFTYASGRVVTETIGILVDGDTAPDPNYAMLLDGSIYWGPASGV